MCDVLFIMYEKNLLKKYLSYINCFEYKSKGLLFKDAVNNFIDEIKTLNILVLEVEKVDFETKKIVSKIREKFKECKILILISSEMNEEIEKFIYDFSIDAYLTFPVLPFQILRSLYCLSNL